MRRVLVPLVLGSLVGALGAHADPQIEVTFDPERVAVGETVTATLRVTNDDDQTRSARLWLGLQVGGVIHTATHAVDLTPMSLQCSEVTFQIDRIETIRLGAALVSGEVRTDSFADLIVHARGGGGPGGELASLPRELLDTLDLCPPLAVAAETWGRLKGRYER